MKKLILLCGLPRSGTTVLANLLLQNQDFYVTATSGILDVMLVARNTIDQNEFFRAMPKQYRDARKLDVLRGVLHGYFAHVEGKVCFDKARGWPSAFEMLEWVLGSREEVRAIVCVRDVRDVLASFEKLYRATSAKAMTSQERNAYVEHRTAVGRAQFILQPSESLGYAMNVVRDAVTRGWKDRMLFVEYDSFCRNAPGELKRIYDFIGEEPFEHDPNNIETSSREDDSVYGFEGLHEIRPEIRPQGTQWSSVFDNAVTKSPFWMSISQASHFWEHLR